MGSRRYAWVKSMACCVCGYTGDTEAHHEPPRSRGGKDKDIVPLCSECHASRHSIQELIPKGHSDALLALAWWEGTGVDLREVRRDMVQAKAAQHGRSKRGCRKPLTHTPLSDLGILLIEE